MNVDTALIKRLREERAWSQEHLAMVSGLSARTIQRLEAEGKASHESRLALAAAFGIEPARLVAEARGEAASPPAATATVAALPAAQRPGLDSSKLLLVLCVLAAVCVTYGAGHEIGKLLYYLTH
ncbi:helix-turn-helix domain-containing protein [Luteimonas aquatica]|uniref:helix-turn-helix domain-containing protein n=1 Tax=Luteimonas aquatica TaxID=450364 RepID=UPI001F5A062D|nr:helix-turn-helix transcriptional regulator [Luteimonas aquatica]